MTHDLAYLDELGHVGHYVSRQHPNCKASPVFGLEGLLLSADQVREFAIYFYKMKCPLFKWDWVNDNPKKIPAYQWEKKGSQLYSLRNVIKSIGGPLFYTGEHQHRSCRTRLDGDILLSPPPQTETELWFSSLPRFAQKGTQSPPAGGGTRDFLPYFSFAGWFSLKTRLTGTAPLRPRDKCRNN